MSKVILITGASRGIGAATARLAATRGYQVCVNYRTDERAANQLVAQIQASGGNALARPTSPSNPKSSASSGLSTARPVR